MTINSVLKIILFFFSFQLFLTCRFYLLLVLDKKGSKVKFNLIKNSIFSTSTLLLKILRYSITYSNKVGKVDKIYSLSMASKLYVKNGYWFFPSAVIFLLREDVSVILWKTFNNSDFYKKDWKRRIFHIILASDTTNFSIRNKCWNSCYWSIYNL